MIGTLYFIIAEKTLKVHLEIRNSIVFTKSVRVEPLQISICSQSISLILVNDVLIQKLEFAGAGMLFLRGILFL